MNKIICRILFIISLFITGFISTFNFLFTHSYCQALPDYIVDSNNLSVIEGGLDKTFDLGLTGPSNLFTIPIWTDEVLDPYLDSTFGWNTDDLSGYVLAPLDPEEDEFVGTNTWKAILGNSSADEFLINQEIQNGFRLFGWSPSELGKLATVIGTGGMLYFKGKIGEVTGQITDIGSNLLVKLGNNFSSIWGNIKDDLIQNGDIYDNSTSSVYFTSTFIDYGYDFRSVNFSRPVYLYSVNGIAYFVTDSTNISISGSYTTSDPNYPRTYTANSINWNPTTFIIDGTTYYSNTMSMLWDTLQNWNGVTGQTNFTFHTSVTTTLNDVKAHITNNGYSDATANSVNYVNELGQPFDLQSYLDDLNGKYVTTDQLGSIKTLVDNNPIVADSTGAHQIFTDNSIQELVDIINDILNQQDGLTDELSDPLPDPDPDPDPNPDPDFTWPEPPDYIPEWMYGPIPDLLPDEMFSIFQPVFDIVGSSYSMHSTFIAIPAILIVAFIIYFIVSVL